MNQAVKILDKTVAAIGKVLGWLLLVMIVLILIESFMRYVLRNPPLIADEFSRYMLVAMAFLGMAYCWRSGGHVRVTTFTFMMPDKLQTWLRLFCIVVAIVIAVILTWSSIIFIETTIQFNALSTSWLRVPLVYPQLALVIGYFLLIPWLIYELGKLIGGMRRGEWFKEKLE